MRCILLVGAAAAALSLAAALRARATPQDRAERLAKQYEGSKPEVCVYCGCGGSLTKEHLLPKSAGGTLTVKACRKCNQDRGNRGDYVPFTRFITRDPATWAAALAATTNAGKTAAWLRKYGGA